MDFHNGCGVERVFMRSLTGFHVVSYRISQIDMLATIVPGETIPQKCLRTCAVSVLTPEAEQSFGPCHGGMQARRRDNIC